MVNQMRSGTSRMLIGAGNARMGFIISKGSEEGGLMELWHKRMGHLSMKITQLITDKVSLWAQTDS